ncbi:MAG: ATP-dependent RNA helicase HrpA [Actinobacteria bacterium]|nr:ATP-dependent RNA helicase HrpA [Actinomycetota bacterium]
MSNTTDEPRSEDRDDRSGRRSRPPRQQGQGQQGKRDQGQQQRRERDEARVALRAAVAETLRTAGVVKPADGLPIGERWDDLAAALEHHQVVIVAGETGSGKSTQLPKLCLQLGRGVAGMIGHTQPRRVAARTIAERVADELGVELGAAVGYSVRFTDQVADGTLVKVMTDGILLAEIQRDRMLRRYDTIIVDEAHERSLNIDFLLGYLCQLLPKRPDLKLIVTSATIDTERFAAHFGNESGPAPVISVEGRTYPVEVRYRPIGDDPDDDRDQVQAVIDAVEELSHEGPGDVLVFLSGEREIHDTADAIRRLDLRHTEVLPLYARLSAVEQHRIFQPHAGRRVVLATNVAETSLTVPGVRYVVDAGSARISRYSHRLKVQRLPIEPVSQASANQRAGRCGRVAAGVCIRLFGEDDFLGRPEFTEPEILRTNLASVILQMTALGLGDVAAFPFLDPPDPRAIRDGFALLEELGAIADAVEDQADRRLTPLGTRLARLPVDPRLGRMVIEAERHGCVREVLVIASALSIQDPRERPAEHRQAADELHRRFAVDGSDFLAYVRLWDHLRERQQQLGSSQFRKLCRAEYLNYLRVREWQDLYSQLRQVAGQIGVRHGTEAGHPDRVHQALLSGLLSQIGMRDTTGREGRGPAADPVPGSRQDRRDAREYRGAHGSKFAITGQSSVAKQLPRWVMAAELVETNRLWARTVAPIQPEWAERLGSHLVKRSYDDPRWEARRGSAVITERATLFGLPVVSGRAVGLDRLDPAMARELFVRHALVEGDWQAPHAFLTANRAFVDSLRDLGERVRRVDLADDAVVFAFYDRVLPASVTSGREFDKWWKNARRADPELLTLSVEKLSALRGAAETVLDPRDFPGTWNQDDLALDITYRFDPGAADDGVLVHVPLAVLNRVRGDGFDWQVPGMREELVAALVKSLPKIYRKELHPIGETTAEAWRRLPLAPTAEPFLAVLGRALTDASGVIVPPEIFELDKVPAHLRVSFSVEDERGARLGVGKDLGELRTKLNPRIRSAVARVMPIEERAGITHWDVEDLPREIEGSADGRVVRGYPALVDDGDSVSLRVLTNPDLQQRVMRLGVRRLLLLTVPVSKRASEAKLTNATRLTIARSPFGLDDLVRDCTVAATDRLLTEAGGPVWTEAEFIALRRRAADEVPTRTATALATVAEILGAAHEVEQRLARLKADPVRPSAEDALAQLDRLVRPGFVVATGAHRLPDVLRYVRGIARRLEKLPDDPAKDRRNLYEIHALEQRYGKLLRRLDRAEITAEVIDLGWQLEELRVAVFAQVLGTPKPVSPQRILKELQRLGG